MCEKWLYEGADPAHVSDLARKRGGPQLGTLGSGNHFLEVQKVDKIFDEKAAGAMGIERGSDYYFDTLWFQGIWAPGLQRLFENI